MIVHQCEQGSLEWFKLRTGIPTASCFDQILTRTGKPSKSQGPYMRTLLAERLMGHPVKEHISSWMQRGKDLESHAVRFYEFQTDARTIPVGFVTTDSGLIGASPDRFVGDDGLLEIKCPSESTHMEYLLMAGGAYLAYKVQVQGQLWVTGRAWADILSYHPELPESLHRIERDGEFIGILSKEVTAFSEKLEDLHASYLEGNR